MPYLDELREGLRLEAGDPIMDWWYDDLVEYLEHLEKNGAVDYAGYAHGDIIPEQDALLNLGLSSKRFKQTHSVYGYFDTVKATSGAFTQELTVQGKKVLKDEDPIHIATFYAYAKQQMEQAVRDALLNLDIPTKIEKKKVVDVYSFYDYAKTQIEQAITDALLNLGIPAKPKLIGYSVNYSAIDMQDVFANNLLMQFDGRARVKMIAESDFYGYIKFKSKEAGVEILGMINQGKPIKANTWKEEDFTVNKDDEINIKVSPSTTVSIFVYNIPEA